MQKMTECTHVHMCTQWLMECGHGLHNAMAQVRTPALPHISEETLTAGSLILSTSTEECSQRHADMPTNCCPPCARQNGARTSMAAKNVMILLFGSNLAGPIMRCRRIKRLTPGLEASTQRTEDWPSDQVFCYAGLSRDTAEEQLSRHISRNNLQSCHSIL